MFDCDLMMIHAGCSLSLTADNSKSTLLACNKQLCVTKVYIQDASNDLSCDLNHSISTFIVV